MFAGRRRTPSVIAVTNCASVQAPMPSVGSGEIFGDVERAERRTQPKPAAEPGLILGLRHRMADEQPPVLNIVLPLTRSGVWGPTAEAGIETGAVINQNATIPRTAAIPARNISRRIVYPRTRRLPTI